jgi:hypothetical protein
MQPRRLIAIVSGLALAVVGGRAVHAAGKADHLICYKMADSAQIAAAVDMIADLQPEFSQRDCRLLKPIEFCVPATKQNITPQPKAPDLVGQPLRQDYICYLAKCPALAVPPAKRVADQFGPHVEQKYKPTKICVPAAKLPIRCGVDTGGPRCGGVCPPGKTCKQSTTAPSGCDCQPLPCGGQPQTGGACGGTCPDPSQVCQLSNTSSGKPTCGCGQLPPPPCGTNPLTGSCGGLCSDPTQVCQVDASGNCGCAPVPQPCGPSTSTPPVCGGTCPNPADSCVPGTGTQPCTCVPPTCRQDPVTGACTGSCAGSTAPGTCHLGPNGCTCGPSPCSIDPASGQCGGVCPNGALCAPDATNNCTCLQPCGTNPLTGSCGGGCPPNETCQVNAQQECLCTPPPPCGVGAETAGVCSGHCVPGQVCKTVPVTTPDGKTTLSCTCVNN